MAVAAYDGLAGLGQPKFRTDDVHDSLPSRTYVEQRNAGRFAIPTQCGDLLRRDLILD